MALLGSKWGRLRGQKEILVTPDRLDQPEQPGQPELLVPPAQLVRKVLPVPTESLCSVVP